MSVARIDLNRCIGCTACFEVCPMDVFRMDTAAKKSVIAYVENCQSCGQCYVNCPSRSLTIIDAEMGFGITSYRATTTARNAKPV